MIGGTAPINTALATREVPWRPNIVGHFAAAGRMADEHRVLQVERIDDGGKVVGIRVHVVAVRRLVGTSVAAAVVSNDPVAFLHEEEHLRIPRVRVERPAVREHDGLAGAPVLEKDARTVFRDDRVHRVSLSVLVVG
jgi:hypothetical protein